MKAAEERRSKPAEERRSKPEGAIRVSEATEETNSPVAGSGSEKAERLDPVAAAEKESPAEANDATAAEEDFVRGQRAAEANCVAAEENSPAAVWMGAAEERPMEGPTVEDPTVEEER